MIGLERNMQDFTYKPYLGKTEKLKDGKHTGKNTLSYGDPVDYSGNFSTPNGNVHQQLFGIETKYTHVLLMYEPDADIKKDGLVQWNGKTYEVRAVRPSLNVLTIALRQQTAGDVE